MMENRMINQARSNERREARATARATAKTEVMRGRSAEGKAKVESSESDQFV
jgi:hypothetical protein